MPIRTISLEMTGEDKASVKSKFNKGYQLLQNAITELQSTEDLAEDVHVRIDITVIMPDGKTKEL